jgi:TPR repeat protein
MRAIVWTLLLVMGFATSAAAVTTESTEPRRIAIVVGNGSYSLGSLANPPRDADLVASAFRQLGFDVHQARDLTTAGFQAFFSTVEDSARDADLLFVYYAGHAFQYEGDNRLLMTDATADSLDSIIAHSLSLSDLVARLSALAPRALVLSLDSCRDNPFAEGKKNVESGLSYLETGEGQLMIAYATSAGKVAYDGYGSNSPYSVALSNALLQATESGRTLSDVFREVRRDVREATNGLQIPWVSSSIEDEIRFAATAEPVLTLTTPGSGLPALEEVLWHYARSSGDPEDLQVYLRIFPQGTHVADARTIIERGATASRAIFSDAGATRSSGPIAAGPTELVLATTGDRSPPPELRAWPVQLPEVPEGLRSVADECDLLAGDPDDPARLAPGIHMGLVNVRLAVRACGAALASEPEDPQTLFQLGRALEAGNQRAWAISYYQAAADRGYGAAMVNLGFMYRSGRGVPRDDGQAFALYKRAALMGNMRARTNLGTMYRNAWGVPQSFEEALLWYRLAGSNGWPNAIDALAGMYARGQGVEKSPEQAFQLYQAAAAIGQTNAMNNLGRAYLRGEGTEKDQAEGVRWLERGVDAGNRFAAQSLALHIKGKDPTRAADLLMMSAERGLADARVELAKLLRERGRKGDAAEALFQARLAEELGNEKAAELRAGLEQGLSADALGSVEDRVRSWLANNGD